MLEEKTVVEQIESHRTGVTFVKCAKVIIKDGAVIYNQPHRFAISQEIDVDELIEAVNSHLGQMGFPAIDLDDINWVKDSVAFVKVNRPRDTRPKEEKPNESVQASAIGIEQSGKGPLV